MTSDFVYLPSEVDPYLLRCWLADRSSGARVWLLSAHTQAATLAKEFDVVHEWDTPEADGTVPARLREVLAGIADPVLTVPLALDRIPMRYRPGARMADLPPHYGLLHRAWQWGFRTARFVAHHSEERIALPFVLDAFHNRHAGQRCFVIGNGPSLGQLDIARLKDEITLGANRCFLGYATWGFPFTYWGVYDKYQIETYHEVYEANIPPETAKFFPVEYAPVMNVASGCPVNSIWPPGVERAFSADPAQLYVGFTVTYMLLQIAACMGCDPIVLIGADHRYDLTRRGYSLAFRRLRRHATRHLRGGRIYETALAAQRAWRKHGGLYRREPALWSTGDAASPTHFTDNYTDGGKNKFLPPEPEEAERDFDCAHAWALANGRRIVNATPGSALDSFPRVNFDDLF